MKRAAIEEEKRTYIRFTRKQQTNKPTFFLFYLERFITKGPTNIETTNKNNKLSMCHHFND